MSAQSFNAIFNELCLPSLEDLAMFSLALEIMEQEEIKKMFLLHFSAKHPKYSLTSNRIAKITSLCKSLNLPEIYERKLLCVVHWIKSQYFDWIHFIVVRISWENKFPSKKDFLIHIMDSVYWSNGVVNQKKTMQQVLYWKNESVIKMFKRASYYCLESEMENLWSNLSKDDQEHILKYDGEDADYYSMQYWACKINGNFEKFLEYISDYMKGKKYGDVVKFSKEPSLYGFVLHVFEGSSSGVKYFYNESAGGNVIKIHIVRIIEIYLRTLQWRDDYWVADTLYFMLSKIEDDDVVRRIFNEFSKIFLELSLKYWPFHKFFVTLVKICSDNIDGVMFYDLMRQLLDGVQNENVDIFLVKKLWRDIPSDLKKSLFVFISKKQKEREIGNLWKNVTMEIIAMFLRDEELRKILMPQESDAVFELVVAQGYDVLDYWLKTCLATEEAIISFMENFITKKAAGIAKNFQRFPIWRVNEFLQWAFKFQEVINKDVIFKAKDEVIEKVGVSTFVRGVKQKKWEDLQEFTEWIMKNRDDYVDSLIELKKSALQEFFKSPEMKLWNDDDFAKSFFMFLQCGITNEDKLKVVINEISFNEGEICAKLLKNGNWESIENFLKVLSTNRRDILTTKQNIFLYIFTHNIEADFEDKNYFENFKKLLYWNLKKDQKMKIWEIKKLIIDNHVISSIEKCIESNLPKALNNILNCLFQDENGKCAKIVTDLKINVIEKVMIKDSFWKKGTNFLMLVRLINWGKGYNKINDVWDVKRYFIESFKNNIRGEIISELVLGGEKNFVLSLFENDENESDFKEILWDLKNFLLEKSLGENDHLFICKIFEKFVEFNQFVRWNGFKESEIQNLKKLVFDEKGVDCCLYWISENKFDEMKHFLDWCIKNDNMKSKMLNLKRSVIERIVSKYSKNWNESYFEKLDKFLLLHSKNLPKDLKLDSLDKFGVKICVECLAKGNLTGAKKFLSWAGIDETEKLLKTFKKKLLKEILDVNNIKYWGENFSYADVYLSYEQEFRIALDKFLYEYMNLDTTEISSMKLDLIEVNFFIIFIKLLNERKHCHLKNFLAWSFDNIKSDKFQPRINKLTKEMFKKYGKEYCILMLTTNNWQAAADFWNHCLDSQTDKKNIKSLLWNFKKECINQILKNETEKKELDIVDCRELYMKDVWIGINKFLSWGPAPSSSKSDIREYKKVIIQEYGIDIIKRYVRDSLEAIYVQPKHFLKFAFGTNNRDQGPGNVLFEFKKKILESLINKECEDLLDKNVFYNIIEETLKFNTELLFNINDMKRSVIQVQGVELCIHLICQNNISALHRFHKWVNSLHADNIVHFKISVAEKLALALTLTLTFTWESFKSFLDYGLDLNYEADKNIYFTMKSYVTECCGDDICYNWILKNQYDEISLFLEWGLEPLENENLKAFKLRLLEKHGAEYCNARILDDDWQKLEKFLVWAFESHAKNNARDEEIINLKIKTLDAEICYKAHLETLSSFLDWGFTCKAQLDKFKKSILKKGHPLNRFVTKQKYKSQKKFQLW